MKHLFDKQNKYSIRKFSIGVCSAVIGLSILNAGTAYADGPEGATSAETVVSRDTGETLPETEGQPEPTSEAAGQAAPVAETRSTEPTIMASGAVGAQGATGEWTKTEADIPVPRKVATEVVAEVTDVAVNSTDATNRGGRNAANNVLTLTNSADTSTYWASDWGGSLTTEHLTLTLSEESEVSAVKYQPQVNKHGRIERGYIEYLNARGEWEKVTVNTVDGATGVIPQEDKSFVIPTDINFPTVLTFNIEPVHTTKLRLKGIQTFGGGGADRMLSAGLFIPVDPKVVRVENVLEDQTPDVGVATETVDTPKSGTEAVPVANITATNSRDAFPATNAIDSQTGTAWVGDKVGETKPTLTLDLGKVARVENVHYQSILDGKTLDASFYREAGVITVGYLEYSLTGEDNSWTRLPITSVNEPFSTTQTNVNSPVPSPVPNPSVTISSVAGGPGFHKGANNRLVAINFDPVSARYIRLTPTESWVSETNRREAGTLFTASTFIANAKTLLIDERKVEPLTTTEIHYLDDPTRYVDEEEKLQDAVAGERVTVTTFNTENGVKTTPVGDPVVTVTNPQKAVYRRGTKLRPVATATYVQGEREVTITLGDKARAGDTVAITGIDGVTETTTAPGATLTLTVPDPAALDTNKTVVVSKDGAVSSDPVNLVRVDATTKYNPTATELQVNRGAAKPTAEEIKAKVTGYPTTARLSVAEAEIPETTAATPAPVNVTVTVTYSDNSTDDVRVPVTVVGNLTPHEHYTPQGVPSVTYNLNDVPSAEVLINNRDQLPNDATYSFKPGTEPVTTAAKTGATTTVLVTYVGDTIKDEVVVPYTVVDTRQNLDTTPRVENTTTEVVPVAGTGTVANTAVTATNSRQNFPPSNAFDSDRNTAWVGDKDGNVKPSLTIELAEPALVNSVHYLPMLNGKVLNPTYYDGAGVITKGYLEYSLTGQDGSWTRIPVTSVTEPETGRISSVNTLVDDAGDGQPGFQRGANLNLVAINFAPVAAKYIRMTPTEAYVSGSENFAAGTVFSASIFKANTVEIAKFVERKTEVLKADDTPVYINATDLFVDQTVPVSPAADGSRVTETTYESVDGVKGDVIGTPVVTTINPTNAVFRRGTKVRPATLATFVAGEKTIEVTLAPEAQEGDIVLIPTVPGVTATIPAGTTERKVTLTVPTPNLAENRQVIVVNKQGTDEVSTHITLTRVDANQKYTPRVATGAVELTVDTDVTRDEATQIADAIKAKVTPENPANGTVSLPENFNAADLVAAEGSQNIDVIVTYSDGTSDSATVSVTVTVPVDNRPDKEKFEPILADGNVTRDLTLTLSDEAATQLANDIKAKVTPQEGSGGTVSLPADFNAATLVRTAGTKPIVVSVTYADNTKDEKTVNLVVTDRRLDKEKYTPTLVPGDVTRDLTLTLSPEEATQLADAIKAKVRPEEGSGGVVSLPTGFDAATLVRTAGTKPIVVTVTYADTTTDEETVNLVVTDRRLDNVKYEPILTAESVARDLTLNVTPEAATALETEIKGKVVPEHDSGGSVTLPADFNAANLLSTAGTKPITVTVTYSDRTTDTKTVKLIVTDRRKDNEKYEPVLAAGDVAHDLVTDLGPEGVTRLADAIKAKVTPQENSRGVVELPENFDAVALVRTEGTKPITVTVTYPDRSTDTKTVNLVVTDRRTKAQKYEPTVTDSFVKTTADTVTQDEVFGAVSVPAEAGDITKEIDGTLPETTTPGSKTARVKVIYSDRSFDTVEVSVQVVDESNREDLLAIIRRQQEELDRNRLERERAEAEKARLEEEKRRAQLERDAAEREKVEVEGDRDRAILAAELARDKAESDVSIANQQLEEARRQAEVAKREAEKATQAKETAESDADAARLAKAEAENKLLIAQTEKQLAQSDLNRAKAAEQEAARQLAEAEKARKVAEDNLAQANRDNADELAAAQRAKETAEDAARIAREQLATATAAKKQADDAVVEATRQVNTLTGQVTTLTAKVTAAETLAQAAETAKNAAEAAKAAAEAAATTAATNLTAAIRAKETAEREKADAVAAAEREKADAIAAAKREKEAALAAAEREKADAIAAANREKEAAEAARLAAETKLAEALAAKVAAETEKATAIAAAEAEKAAAIAAANRDKAAAETAKAVAEAKAAAAEQAKANAQAEVSRAEAAKAEAETKLVLAEVAKAEAEQAKADALALASIDKAASEAALLIAEARATEAERARNAAFNELAQAHSAKTAAENRLVLAEAAQARAEREKAEALANAERTKADAIAAANREKATAEAAKTLAEAQAAAAEQARAAAQAELAQAQTAKASAEARLVTAEIARAEAERAKAEALALASTDKAAAEAAKLIAEARATEAERAKLAAQAELAAAEAAQTAAATRLASAEAAKLTAEREKAQALAAAERAQAAAEAAQAEAGRVKAELEAKLAETLAVANHEKEQARIAAETAAREAAAALKEKEKALTEKEEALKVAAQRLAEAESARKEAEAKLAEQVKPVDPTVAPTTPTETPVDPTVAPTTPTETPVEPTVAPTTPTETPVDPTVAPTTPTETPVEPTVVPTTPTETPVDPTVAPTTPTEAPVEQPTPGKPVDKPADDSVVVARLTPKAPAASAPVAASPAVAAPSAAAPATSAPAQASLPETGDEDSMAFSLGMAGLMSALGLMGVKSRNED